jgi:hypothetical protein
MDVGKGREQERKLTPLRGVCECRDRPDYKDVGGRVKQELEPRMLIATGPPFESISYTNKSIVTLPKISFNGGIDYHGTLPPHRIKWLALVVI